MTEALALTRQGIPTARALWKDIGTWGRCAAAFAVSLLLTLTVDDALTIFAALAAGAIFKAVASLRAWLRNGVAIESSPAQVWVIDIYNKID